MHRKIEILNNKGNNNCINIDNNTKIKINNNSNNINNNNSKIILIQIITI